MMKLPTIFTAISGQYRTVEQQAPFKLVTPFGFPEPIEGIGTGRPQADFTVKKNPYSPWELLKILADQKKTVFT